MLRRINLKPTARPTTRRVLLSAALALCALPLSAFRPAGEMGREFGGGSDLKSAYFAEFTGVGEEGRDLVWRGAAAGAAAGELTVRLAHAGRAVDAARPTWPVEGVVFVSGEDPARAFAAEVRGTIDWPARRLRLEGEVSVGYMKGAHLEQTADLLNYDLSGEMRFTPATLATAR